MAMERWELSLEERERFIKVLTPSLSALRARAGLSQEELCNILGISRQTYSSIELQKRRMSWSTYLTLIWFYDNNVDTRDLLRKSGAYPEELLRRFNMGRSPVKGISDHLDSDLKELLNGLDEQAIHSIKTMLLVEYARCNNIPGEAVVKSFGGVSLRGHPDAATEQALKNIRARAQNSRSEDL